VGAVPVLDGGSTGLGLALNLDLLGLVCAELAGNVGLLGGSRGLGKGELLDLAFRVGGLDGGRLVSLELAEVEVLDEIGYGRRINEQLFDGCDGDMVAQVPWRTAVGVTKVRRKVVADCCLARRTSDWRCGGCQRAELCCAQRFGRGQWHTEALMGFGCGRRCQLFHKSRPN
jgi:hypothetical protein